ncbi:MAG: hypothetical protein WA917_00315 [Comamonas sp.]
MKTEEGLTKITAKIFEPAYRDLNNRLKGALLSRDAFLDHVIAQEIPYLHRDLEGKRLSKKANQYISHCLKKLGGREAPPLKQISIAIKHKTAKQLRSVVDEHNLVRDAFLNRLIFLLRASNNALAALDLPTHVASFRRDGTVDIPTSPLQAIEITLADPFYYLRAGCEDSYGCGLNLMDLPEELHGLSCYIEDREVPTTEDYKDKIKRLEEMNDLIKNLELKITTTKQKEKSHE